MKIDVKNTDPKYWEDVLKKHGMAAPKDEIAAQGPSRATPNRDFDVRDDMKKLREKIDGSDRFMEGYQVRKIQQLDREIPDWSIDDFKTRALIDRAFPKWRSSPSQRKRASRWVCIIYLFYRMNMSYSQVAEELNTTSDIVNDTLRSIRRVASGRRADNSGPLVKGTIPLL